jgi:hypothetical protein
MTSGRPAAKRWAYCTSQAAWITIVWHFSSEPDRGASLPLSADTYLNALNNSYMIVSPLNVLKGTYDHRCYRARSDEYQHVMADPPAASRAEEARHVVGRHAEPRAGGLGFGRIVASEIEAPNMLVNLV